MVRGTNPYDLEIAARVYDRLVDDEGDIDLYLSLASEAGGPILELACGTGRCLIPLIREGYDVIGLDLSQAMLAQLEQNLANEHEDVSRHATPICGDGSSFSLPLRFGMAFIAANSFVHLETKQDQEAFVNNVYDHLRPGGLLAIDTLNPDPGLEVVHRDLDADLVNQVLHVQTTYREGECILAEVQWKLRYTYRFELEHLLEKAGFTILHLWGDYDRTPFGESTDRLFVVARKPQEDMPVVVQVMRAEVPETVQ